MIAAVSTARRQSSQSSIATQPIRNRMLPTQASAASAATRWISPMSLLSRDTMSPRRVRA